MAWFFAETVSAPTHTISGENAHHIIKSLRMKIGEPLTICDSSSIRHDCIIEEISGDSVVVRIERASKCENEPDTEIILYQALPKGEKMEFIIQKSVELGVSKIVPMLSKRCVSRPDEKSMRKKVERWNKIALSAAMQSRRGKIPEVSSAVTFEQAVNLAGDSAIMCYELGGVPMGDTPQIKNDKKTISLFIGSEGGFEESESQMVLNNGGSLVSLGKRILRAETAPLAAISIIMYLTGNLC